MLRKPPPSKFTVAAIVDGVGDATLNHSDVASVVPSTVTLPEPRLADAPETVNVPAFTFVAPV